MQHLKPIIPALFAGFFGGLVPVAAVAQTTVPECGSQTWLVDTIERIFSGFDYAVGQMANTAQCQNACLSNEGCVSYIWCQDAAQCALILEDPSAQPGGGAILAGTYDCGDWGEVVLRGGGTELAGEYEGSWFEEWRGILSFSQNNFGVWNGDWGQPDIGRWGYFSNISVSAGSITAEYATYPEHPGYYSGGGAIALSSGVMSCTRR